MEVFLDESIKYCPNCSGKSFVEINSNYLNVYSELISRDLGITQQNLIKRMSSLKCLNCDLRFWKNPLNEKTRLKIYTEILPVHPKGDDSSGDNFNFDGLKTKLIGENKESTKRKRIIEGYLSSMKFKSEKEFMEFKDLINELEEYDSIKNKLNSIFARGPRDFSRHAGFRDTSINNDILCEISKNDSKIID